MVEVAPTRLPARPRTRPAAAKAKTTRPKKKAQGSLGAISEAAEWAEQSTLDTSGEPSTLTAEVDALWAEAGLAPPEATSHSAREGTPTAASAAAAAVAAACAARKGGLGVAASQKGSGTSSGGAAEPPTRSAERSPERSAPSAKKECLPAVESSEGETSEEEVEVQHFSIPPRSPRTEVEIEVELEVEGLVEVSERKPSSEPRTGRLTALKGVAAPASPTRAHRMVARDDLVEEALKARKPTSEDSEGVPKSTLKSLKGLHAAGSAAGSAAGTATDSAEVEMEDEWEEIGRRTEELAKQAREAKGKVAPKQDVLGQPVSYKEVHGWLWQEFGTGKTGEDQGSGEERMGKDLLLRVKGTKFDFNDTMHHRMLRTIYCKLARCKVCPRTGSHWEVLGFQGNDPLTDLNRSAGLLNVLQMFFFFAHYFDLLKSAYHLSQDDEQNFPLAAVGINITKIVMDQWAAGHLESLEDRFGAVHATARAFSAGLYHFYFRWRTQKRTIRDSELTFNEVKRHLSSQPVALLEELDKAQMARKQKEDLAEQVDFTDLGQVAACFILKLGFFVW
ncbi:unnamed protein product [Durusdinium trenchii]|uniref:ELMO domain-containing protein n=1 Tax=Durusdinium trenchii TaxID=1381693 RepID=A0ABP0NUW2_9DINO